MSHLTTSITGFSIGREQPETTIGSESLIVGRVPLPPPPAIHKSGNASDYDSAGDGSNGDSEEFP